MIYEDMLSVCISLPMTECGWDIQARPLLGDLVLLSWDALAQGLYSSLAKFS